jgi:hypothetical protein
VHDRFDPDFPLYEQGGGQATHSAWRVGAVENVDRVRAGFLNAAALPEHLIELPALWGRDLEAYNE